MRNLAAAGCRVLALVHRPRPVEHPLVDYRQWDLAIPMTSAWFDGADGAFLMAPIQPDMVDIGKRLNQAVADARVPRIVRLSIASVMQRPEVLAGWAHRQIDQDLLVRRPDALVLRPHGFMQNLLGLADAVKQGTLPQALAPGARDAMIDTRDIARAAVTGLLNDRVSGAVDLSGPQAVAPEDVAAALSALTGQRVAAVTLSNTQASRALLQIGMPEWLIDRILEFRSVQEEGAAAMTTDGMQKITGEAGRTLATFLKDHAEKFCDDA